MKKIVVEKRTFTEAEFSYMLSNFTPAERKVLLRWNALLDDFSGICDLKAKKRM